jgi:hypothetical protein
LNIEPPIQMIDFRCSLGAIGMDLTRNNGIYGHPNKGKTPIHLIRSQVKLFKPMTSSQLFFHHPSLDIRGKGIIHHPYPATSTQECWRSQTGYAAPTVTNDYQ